MFGRIKRWWDERSMERTERRAVPEDTPGLGQRVKVRKGGRVRRFSLYRILFGTRPLKRHKGRKEKATRKRRKANKLARRKRRINRRNG